MTPERGCPVAPTGAGHPCGCGSPPYSHKGQQGCWHARRPRRAGAAAFRHLHSSPAAAASAEVRSPAVGHYERPVALPPGLPTLHASSAGCKLVEGLGGTCGRCGEGSREESGCRVATRLASHSMVSTTWLHEGENNGKGGRSCRHCTSVALPAACTAVLWLPGRKWGPSWVVHQAFVPSPQSESTRQALITSHAWRGPARTSSAPLPAPGPRQLFRLAAVGGGAAVGPPWTS